MLSCNRKRRNQNGSGKAQSLLRHNAVASHFGTHLSGDHEALSPQLVGCSNEPMFSYENAVQTEAAYPHTVV